MSRIRSALRALQRRARVLGGADSGSAIIEFLGISLILLIPLTYLVLVLGKLQAGTFAVEGAAKAAARAFTLAEVGVDPEARAVAAIKVALADQGFELADSEFTIDCEDRVCRTAGTALSARVTVRVVLPGVPAAIGSDIPLQIPVIGEHMTIIDPLRASS